VKFTAPVPDCLDSYYPSSYRGYGPVVLAVLRALYRLRVRGWVSDRSPGRVLEVGCGPGLMLEALQEKGWSVVGVERNEDACSDARQRLGAEVVAGGIENVDKTEGFDLIVLFNVLEHVADPMYLLKECAARLNRRGALVVSVPNLRSWQASFGGPVWLHLDVPRHLVHFTPDSLSDALQSVGLSVSELTTVSPEHDPFGWIQSVLNRMGLPFNSLTQYLMGLKGLDVSVVCSTLLAMLLVIPAIAVSVISWVFQRGALMEVTAVATDRSKEQE
tara:strand:+ start:2316 stop:3137 length:822 start_codon:yes stop_codon:yes gene_type:complete